MSTYKCQWIYVGSVTVMMVKYTLIKHIEKKIQTLWNDQLAESRMHYMKCESLRVDNISLKGINCHSCMPSYISTQAWLWQNYLYMRYCCRVNLQLTWTGQDFIFLAIFVVKEPKWGFNPRIYYSHKRWTLNAESMNCNYDWTDQLNFWLPQWIQITFTRWLLPNMYSPLVWNLLTKTDKYFVNEYQFIKIL